MKAHESIVWRVMIPQVPTVGILRVVQCLADVTRIGGPDACAYVYTLVPLNADWCVGET
jgi:hypothetical protein